MEVRNKIGGGIYAPPPGPGGSENSPVQVGLNKVCRGPIHSRVRDAVGRIVLYAKVEVKAGAT